MNKSKPNSTTDWKAQLNDFRETLPKENAKKRCTTGQKPKSGGQNNSKRNTGPKHLQQKFPHN